MTILSHFLTLQNYYTIKNIIIFMAKRGYSAIVATPATLLAHRDAIATNFTTSNSLYSYFNLYFRFLITIIIRFVLTISRSS